MGQITCNRPWCGEYHHHADSNRPNAACATRGARHRKPDAGRAAVSLDDLWSAYKTNSDNEARDRLVLHYTGLVTYVASRVGASMPSTVDYSDLIQSGVIGLMDAVARFEPERGLKFETYAVTRIRGAIIDELRALDWVPRSVRKKARDLDAAAEELSGAFRSHADVGRPGRGPRRHPERARQTRAQMSRMRVVALDELLSTGLSGENVSLAETLADPFAQHRATRWRSGRARLCRRPWQRWRERDRAVLVQSYIDGLTLAQIGQRLGVTESRVSQIRTKALREARGQLLARLTA